MDNTRSVIEREIKTKLNSIYGRGIYKSPIDDYIKADIGLTEELYKNRTDYTRFYNQFEIKNVIFNPPASIVFWQDGTKTVVKCGEHDIYDPEKGIAMAIAKRALGNQGNYYNKIKEWLPINYNPAIMSVDLAKFEDFTGHQEAYKSGYIQKNKYGDKYDTRLFFAGKGHKVVCAGDCYHVKNIKKENALVYISLEAAMMDGCRPCKHCNGKHKEEE